MRLYICLHLADHLLCDHDAVYMQGSADAGYQDDDDDDDDDENGEYPSDEESDGSGAKKRKKR